MNLPGETAPETMALHEIAHARAGDKGDTCILMIAPYLAADFQLLVHEVTPEAVANHFGNHGHASVIVTSLPNLRAISIVIRDQLAGGVTRSLRIDPHGKTLASHMLDMRIDRPISFRSR